MIAEMWTLESAPAEGRGGYTFRITAGAVRTVGRAVRADFIVDAPLVSRFHCRLTASGDGRLLVEDLGSTNGTFVNGVRISSAEAGDGDRIGIGRVELVASRGIRGPD